MSALHTLFRVFSQFILKVTGIYVAASLLGVLLLDKLFGGYQFYLGMLVFIGPLLAWALTFMLVPKNLDWILALPISKRNVLVLHYITGVFATVVVALASLFVIVALFFIKKEVHIDLHQMSKAPTAVLPKDQLGPFLAGIDIYGWMTALLMISFFHALSMSISRPATTKRLYLNLWNDARPLVRWGVRVGWIGLIAFGALFREYLLAPFGIFVFAITTFLLVTTFNTSHALGVGKQQRQRWLAVSGAVAAAQIIFLFGHAMSGVHADSFDRRVASVMFLGPLSGGMAREDLARLLEGDINEERVEDLGGLYLKRYWGRRKIRPSEERELSFFRAIEKKKTFQDVAATARLFDPEDLDAADVRALLARLQPLSAECRCDLPLNDYLPAHVSADEALEMLGSSDDALVQYGLLWARYRAVASDRRFLATIQNNLVAYTDRAKLSALLTLGVLEGRRYGFNDWLDERRRNGRVVSSQNGQAFGLAAVDCASWKLQTFTELTADDAPVLNYCARRRADLTKVADLEAVGWLEPPLDTKARAAVRKALKLR